MVNDIYDPLCEYVDVFKDRFKEVCQSTFKDMADEASVDVEANRRTCSEIDDANSMIARINQQISNWTILCVFLWILFAVGAYFIYKCFSSDDAGAAMALMSVAAVILFLQLSKIHPKLKDLKGDRDDMEALREELSATAWKQMEPLNRLYDWDIFTRMMSRTVPRLEFDPYFTAQRLEDLKAVYNWDESFNDERSVLFSHSGLINGNPFVLCRTKKMEWGVKQYTGTLTIHWTERRRGSDGKYYTVSRSETLTATVTQPYPEYYKKTRLIYGNTAAPDLTFYRKKSGYASKLGSISFKLKKSSLHRKARKLSENDYAMMSNEDFEVAFDSSNRNHNQQFALLFTPLAQNSMMCILADKEVGYGDDFDFEKDRMINVITADHLQVEELDMDPTQYRSYCFDKAAEDFYKINVAHFRALYFAFAPLLAVPMYQQIRSHKDIYGTDMERRSIFWEHEAIANYWGIDKFKHPDCVTDCILKTKVSRSTGSESTIRVSAYGYKAVPRVTYVKKFGGDGRWHNVPVHWNEYLPVVGNGHLAIKEDNVADETGMTQTQRIDRITTWLSENGHDVYRRHISSHLKAGREYLP